MMAKLPMPAADARSLRRVSPLLLTSPSLVLLPIAINLVPLVEPFALQLHELLIVRYPHLDDLRIEAFRIERRFLQRCEIADIADHHRLAFFREAPVEEQPGGVRMRGGLRDACRELRHRRAFLRE